jgi:hypothetical protein
MIRHSLVVVAVVMSLAGCAAVDAPGSRTTSGLPPEAFAHRVGTSELVLFWNCSQPEPGVIRIEGIAQSPWQAQPIRYLEFTLLGVGAQEETTAKATGTARDIQIMTNQSSPFQLNLKSAGAETRFDLYYNYRYAHEYDSSSSLIGTRGTVVAGPAMVNSRLFAQTETFLARDVCSPTEHLAR